MRAVLQRVTEAMVKVDGAVIGSIGVGTLIFVGVEQGDTERDALYLADKCAGLRIFEDGHGRMNLSLAEVGGGVLLVSQFTLCADCRKGRRPSFVRAARPEKAEALYELVGREIRKKGIDVQTGRFGAMMDIHLVNHGPVTILLDSRGALQAG